MDQTMKTFVKHPFHKHSLILRKLSCRAKLLQCYICEEKDVEGSTYCCEDCGVFIHSECVSLPLRLHHPFHPDHPIKLVLQKDTYCKICAHKIYENEYRYSCKCDGCSQPSLCVRCVNLTLLLNDEVFEGPEYLPQHNHPLTYLDVTMPNRIKCEVCTKFIYGPVYGCRICLFAMHVACAQLPKKMMRRYFHPQHPLTLPPPEWKREPLISPDMHWHPLLSFPLGEIRDQTDISCRVCNKTSWYIDDEAYSCVECRVVIHKKCTEIPQQLLHPTHPNHPLILLLPRDSEGPSYSCGNCLLSGFEWYDFGFKCKCCSFHLCIDCAVRFLTDGDKVMSLDFQDILHQHPLTLRQYPPCEGETDTTAAGGFCEGCYNREKGRKSSLLYGCDTCDGFSIHKVCVKKVRKINHPFHPSHSLRLIGGNDFTQGHYERCGGCFLKILFIEPDHREWHYCFHCAECSFYLCKECAFNEYPTINHRPHMHELTYFHRVHLRKLLCNYCGITCTRDLYRCVDCNFNLHHDCASLPLTAIDEYHHHELSLCAKALGDYADKNEFNCSHCQCSRDPKLGLYACEPCHYYAHIHCMLPEEKVKRKKVAETVCQKWNKKISTQKEKVEKLHTQLNEAQEELESMMIEKEQEIEDLAIRDDIDEL